MRVGVKLFGQNNAPLKFRILPWLVVQNKLSTVDNIGKRLIRVGNICVFCNNHNETALHLFVNCPNLSTVEFLSRLCVH